MAQLSMIATAGVDDPTRATLPLHLARAAREGGIDVAVALAGDAMLLMREAIRESVRGVGLPPLEALFAHAGTAGVPLHVRGM